MKEYGTTHEHEYSAIQKNWQGREFDRCLTCGAVFFFPVIEIDSNEIVVEVSE